MIYPHLCYCIVVWGCAKPTYIQKLIKLQKRSVRLITRSMYRAPSNPLFLRLYLLKLPEIYKSQVSLFVFKFINNMLPASCSDHFQYNTTPSYSMRKINILALPSCRTIVRESSMSVVGPKIFNSLSDCLQNCYSLIEFKYQLFEYFFSPYSSS